MNVPQLAWVGVLFAGAIAAAGAEPRPDLKTPATLDITQPFQSLPAVTTASTPSDVTTAIQSRFDFFFANKMHGRVLAPAGHWPICRPIFMNGDGMELAGAGVGQTFIEAADGYRAIPMINVGARTLVEDRPLQDCNRVGLTDAAARVLDSSVTGERFGLRTYGEYPADHFPATTHHVAQRNAKPWSAGVAYKPNDVVTTSTPGAPSNVLAICTAEHQSGKTNEPGKGADWPKNWVIQVPAHVQFTGDPLAAGAYDPQTHRAGEWANVQALTVDFAFTLNDDPKVYNGSRMLCCAGKPDRAKGRIWSLSIRSNGDLDLSLGLDDSASHGIRLAKGCSAPGTYRLALQVDLKAHAVEAWLRKPGEQNWTQTCLDDKTIPAGATFKPTEFGYFIIASDGSSATCSNGRELPPLDITVCGLHTSAALRYAGDAALKRLDNGAAPDDNFCYFTNDAGTLAFLPLTDHPTDADSQTQRLLVTVQHGPAAGDANQKGYGYLKVPQGIYGVGSPAVTDLTLKPGPVWGVGVVTWHTLDLQLHRLDIRGGFYAVGDLFFGAQYPFDVRDCVLSGSEAAFNGACNIIYMKHVSIDPVGRCGILISGSNAQLEDVTFGDPRHFQSEYYFRHIATVDYGGMNVADHIRMLAPQGSQFPAKAAFSQENIGSSRTSLVVRNCQVGNMGPQAAFIELPLIDAPCAAKLLAENCSYTGSPIAAWIRTASPWWTGQFLGFDPHAPVQKFMEASLPALQQWKPEAAYHKRDHVIYGGRAWLCTQDSPPGVSPSEGANWTEIMTRIYPQPRRN